MNRSWELVPWADVVYGCDFRWWESVGGLVQFGGLKVTQDPNMQAYRKNWGVHRVFVDRQRDDIQVGTLGRIGWGGNSGFQALNLAVQFGVKRIILVGFDMRVDRGLHWHPDHGKGMNNPTARNVERWRRVTDEAAPVLAALGVKVMNASLTSALARYPVMSWEQALEEGTRDDGRRSIQHRKGRRGGEDQGQRISLPHPPAQGKRGRSNAPGP